MLSNILYVVVVYALLMYTVPKLIKSPTNIDFVDKIVLYTNTNQQFVVSSSILVALSVFIVGKYLCEGDGN